MEHHICYPAPFKYRRVVDFCRWALDRAKASTSILFSMGTPLGRCIEFSTTGTTSNKPRSWNYLCPSRSYLYLLIRTLILLSILISWHPPMLMGSRLVGDPPVFPPPVPALLPPPPVFALPAESLFCGLLL